MTVLHKTKSTSDPNLTGRRKKSLGRIGSILDKAMALR
jgi:hypothetical protein